MIKKATLADVAQQVGVSGKTVSRVVNGEPNVSAAVRDAVQNAIAQLGYQPNLAARSLASTRSFIVGVLSLPYENSYFHAVHASLGSACRSSGYHMVLEQLDGRVGIALDQLRKFLSDIRPEAVVLTPGIAQMDEVSDYLKRIGMPTVAFNSSTSTAGSGIVLADEERGEILLADHLWELGHRRFAVFQLAGSEVYRGRVFRQRLLELGADAAQFVSIEIAMGVPGLEAGRQAALTLIDGGFAPTALFAFGDELAAGAISLFLTKGLRVPGDISVVGFDDSEIGRAIWPALTTIRQPIAIMAENAIAMIVARTDAQRAETDRPIVICPVEMVTRDSSGPAPATAKG